MRRKGISEVTPGFTTWRWLSGIAAKQGAWLLGSIAGRGGYEAWAAHLVEGLQEPKFLSTVEATGDPWKKSRLVGEKISGLAKDYASLSRDRKVELARKAEVELKAGIDMLSAEKKRVFNLLKAVTAPLDE